MSLSEGIIGRIIASLSPPQNAGLVGRFLALPPALQNTPQAQTVEGEVAQVTREGIVRIATAHGDIEVQVRGRPAPQPGQAVQVDIPRGTPPRQALIRPAPPSSSAPEQQPELTGPRASATNSVPQQDRIPLSRHTLTPNLQTQAQSTPSPQPAAAPVSLDRNDAVRLLPLSPLQAQKAAAQFLPLQNLKTTVTQAALAQAPVPAAALAPSDEQQVFIQAGRGEVRQTAQFFKTSPRLFFQQTPPLFSEGAPPPIAARLITQIFQFQTFQGEQGETPLSLLSPAQKASEIPLAGLTTARLTSLPAGTVALPGGGAPGPATGSVLTIQIALAGSAPLQSPSSALQTPPLDATVLHLQPPEIQLESPESTPLHRLQATAARVQSTGFTLTQGRPDAIPAQVVGVTSQNLPVVVLRAPGAAAAQVFVLQVPAAAIQPGSQIQILPRPGGVLTQPPSLAPQPAGGLPPAPLSLPLLLQPGPWPALDEIYQALTQTAPQAAHALGNVTPSPALNPAQLGPAVFLFLAAVRSGDFAGWLGGGKTLDALSRTGKSNALSRLTQEGNALNRADAASAGEWRGTAIPVFYEDGMHKIILFTRRDRDDGSGGDSDRQTRFLFDLDLSRMGPVQLDGLVRGQRLDLIVRTEAPLSEPMRQAMRQSYIAALEASALSGDLSFQGDARHWVHVMKQEERFGASA